MADQHKHGHGPKKPGAFMEEHLGSAITSYGKWMDKAFEHLLSFFINGILQKLALGFLIIMIPVILLEFVLHSLRF